MQTVDVSRLFSDRIRKLRMDRKLTVEEVAINCGVRAATIYNYESGRNMPRMEIVVILAEYFEVSVDYLVGYTNEMQPKSRKTSAGKLPKVRWKRYKSNRRG